MARVIWENGEKFDPDRWLPERIKNVHPFAYIPFYGGPQLCLGKDMAIVECKTVLAMVLPKFRLELVPGQNIVLRSFILFPKYGMQMQVHARTG